ncbi:sigma-B regulation protein RsbU (phosphoserine phosphatase) [Prevotellaceae bacterium HUN156]|nr:sigma-B regulation protein RsbU (phosphoserine phosphatase) [Prevotellaceae bacterium HUN156]
MFFKKSPKPYPRSFARRLTWRIMLTFLVLMGLASYIFYKVGKESFLIASENICSEYLESHTESVRRILSDIYVASVNTAPVIEEHLNQPDQLQDIMERMVELNPYLRSCGISFIENYYPQKGRWYCPYAVRNEDGSIEKRTIADAKHDYLKQEWFTQTLAQDSAQWSKPFFDDGNQEMPLVSYLIPIHDKQGRTVAVLGADLSLKWLSEKLCEGVLISYNSFNEDNDDDDFNDKEHIYFFIIDKEGNYIAHPDHKRVIKANYFAEARAASDSIAEYVGRQMTDRVQGQYNKEDNGNNLVINGQNSFIYYMPIKHIDWSIAFVIPTFMIQVILGIIGVVLMFLITLGLMIIFIVGHIVIKRSTLPIKLLSWAAGEIAKGQFNTPLPRVDSHDEIHLLRDSFERMQHSLTQYIAELQETTAQKSAIESELKIAHDIQMAMLPKTFPPYPERNDVDIYGMVTPAKGVGGDLFDFFIRDQQLFFCIGDVSGKGIPAALFMAVTRSLFRNIANHVTEPDHIVSTLNNALIDGNETNMFVTVFVGVLNLNTGHLQYCNGGHNAPLLVGRDVGALSCEPNLPIGVLADFKYKLQEVNLDQYTTIFLYTDGLNEAEDCNHKLFGDNRVWNIARQALADGAHQPEQLINRMNQAIHTYVGTAEQSDDLTMLAIQYTGTSNS